MKWKIYKRKARRFRHLAIRGEQYDGSRWELQNTYDSEKDFKKGWDTLNRKKTSLIQYKYEVKL